MAMLRFSLLFLCVGFGCSKTSGTEPAQNVAREIAPLPKQPLPVPDGSFSGEVEAAGAVEVAQEKDRTGFSIPLDTGNTRLLCFVYPDFPNRPTAAGDFGEVMASLNPLGTIRHAQLTQVLPEDDEPVLFMELQFGSLLEGDKPLKLMAYLHPRKFLLCMLPMAGYTESFKRITLDLARSLRRPQGAAEAQPPPDYVELHLHRRNGVLVGFDRYAVEKTTTGRRGVDVFTFRLAPRKDGLSILETYTSEGIDEYGILGIKGYHRYVDGREITRAQVKRVGVTEYTYEVTEQGQKRSGKLTSTRGLSSVVSAAGTLREELLSGKVQELRFDLFNPEVPRALSEVVWKKSGAPGTRHAELDMGRMKMSATLDENGLVENAEINTNGSRSTQERVYRRGAP